MPFYLRASLAEKMLNIAPTLEHTLSFTVLRPKQPFYRRTTHPKLLLLLLTVIVALSLSLFCIYLGSASAYSQGGYVEPSGGG